MYQDNSIKMHFYVIGSAFNPRKSPVLASKPSIHSAL